MNILNFSPKECILILFIAGKSLQELMNDPSAMSGISQKLVSAINANMTTK